MENASKALIIAGAILLAILIISLGIAIYRQSAGVLNNNAMSEVEMQQFNAKFTQYEGTVRGAQVNAMLQTVLSNNMSVDDDDRRVAVTGDVAMAKDATSLPSTLASTGATYTVQCVYGNSGAVKGLVQSLTVEKQ